MQRTTSAMGKARGHHTSAVVEDTNRPAVRDVRPWLLAFGSSVLLWAAFPPLDLWPLAWIAPLGWLWLIAQPQWSVRRPYLMVYVAGLVHWLLLIQGVRLPHWSAYFGWLALSAYLGVYLPVFIAATRCLVHRLGWSTVVAAPVVWTSLEVVRSYLFTGFALSLLGHSQVAWTELIQVADLGGAYAVSFVVMAIAAVAERAWPCVGRDQRWPRFGLIGALLLAATLGYGWFRTRPVDGGSADTPLRVALVQGSLDTMFGADPERIHAAFLDYVDLTVDATRKIDGLDLIVWPESMFTANEPMVTYDRPLQMVPEWDGTLDALRRRLDDYASAVRGRFAWVTRQTRTPMLVGLEWETYRHGQPHRSNSAVLLSADGQVLDRYDKMHPVMFGEYVPFGDWFPWLYRLTPMSRGLDAGDQPRSLQVGEYRLSPSICFENTVPHLIRRQVRAMQSQGQNPDALVTISNDGWFWGSSLLDLHLTCGVFRAIESGRPMLIASNTGLSAWIDAHGRILAQGSRRQDGVLQAEIRPATGSTLYLRWGDWFPLGCLAISVVGVAYALRQPNLTAVATGGDETAGA